MRFKEIGHDFHHRVGLVPNFCDSIVDCYWNRIILNLYGIYCMYQVILLFDIDLLLYIGGGLYLYRPAGSHFPKEGQQGCTDAKAI